MAKTKAAFAPIFSRFKAFIIDMFLIAMPLFYATTYLILGSKEALWQNQLAITAIWAIYGVIVSLFFAFKAQTPGYKAQNIYLIDIRTGKKASFLLLILRFLCFILAGFCIVGLCVCFFRKDRLNLHDLLSKTVAVIRKN